MLFAASIAGCGRLPTTPLPQLGGSRSALEDAFVFPASGPLALTPTPRSGLARPHLDGEPIDVDSLPRASASEVPGRPPPRAYDVLRDCPEAPPKSTWWVSFLMDERPPGGAADVPLVLSEGRVLPGSCAFVERARRHVSARRISERLPLFAFRGCGRACKEAETLGLVFPLAKRVVSDTGQVAIMHAVPSTTVLVPLEASGAAVMAQIGHVPTLELLALLGEDSEPRAIELVDHVVAPRTVYVEIMPTGDGRFDAMLFVGKR